MVSPFPESFTIITKIKGKSTAAVYKLLINLTVSGAPLYKVALPDFDGLCSADAYPILPIEGKCNRVFLAYDMRSTFFLDYILQFCNRTNLPKVNRKEVAGFRTPLPPIELQNEFAAFVGQIDKSKDAIRRSLTETQTLFDSLMQEYFG